MSLPLSFYKSTFAGSFAARGAEAPVGSAPMTATQQITSSFMAPAKKEFSAVAFAKDLAIVSGTHPLRLFWRGPFLCLPPNQGGRGVGWLKREGDG